MFDPELETFKHIDLRAYAASHGYAIDSRESWRGSAIMRHAAGDKIVIKRDLDGHYIYFSVRDDRDNGTIIDWVQFRAGLSLGEVRKELRPWIGQPPVPVPVFPSLPKTAKDRVRVEIAYAATQDAATGHPYLEGERGLPGALLALDRFAGRVRLEVCNRAVFPNAIFPHFDQTGLCGYEIKNSRGFTGFAAGGSKGLWLSHEAPDDSRLVFCESAIDSLSHAVLFPDNHARYASIGGKPNPDQPELIRTAVARMPLSSEIVAAMDADTDGRKLAEVVRRAVEMSGRGDLRFKIHEPSEFKDWNDQLRARPKLPLPCRAHETLNA